MHYDWKEWDFRAHSDEIPPELQLLVAVILQAVCDASAMPAADRRA